jgi:hypothetical protein
MAKSTSKSVQPDQHWVHFVADGLVEKHIKVEDIMSDGGEIPTYSSQFSKQALKTLKSALTPDAHRRLSGRFRKYKYSAKNNTTTLTIKDETLQRLKTIADKARIGNEKYDLILEYLMDPEWEIKTAKEHVAELDMPLGIDVNDKAQLLRAKLRFRTSTFEYMLTLIEHAFKMGFLACKGMHAKKRTSTAIQEAADEHLDKLKGL